MIELDNYFEIQVDKNKMKATLVKKKKFEEDIIPSFDDLVLFIHQFGIRFGLKEEVILDLLHDSEDIGPKTIAEGKTPFNGEDAYLNPILPEVKQVDHNSGHTIDLKQVINILSVTKGQLIGEKILATQGVPGTNVYGEQVEARPGKDFFLRQGKNTRIDKNQIFSLIDGQMNIEKKVIHVFPVYEVNGDLDLKVGNISFVGGVNIRGSVPSGFEVRAKGDIKVHGTVESATLISEEGSIFVSAGIVGQGKGLIQAKGDLHTSFINQANVKVEGDVHAIQSILHSDVQAEGGVYCHKGKGNIVGGSISAVKGIVAKEIGNSHNTMTSLYLGINQQLLTQEKNIRQKIKQLEDELKKLNLLLTTIQDKENQGLLTPQEKIMKLRIKNTMQTMADEFLETKDKYEDIQEKFQSQSDASVKVEQKIFPQVDIHFGKYKRKIVTPHQYVKIYYDSGEIVTTSL
ncbi:MAG: FapA family protein [Bacillaceae bacterium]|nr:FapA family protein [Bacillaceae bacterium]